MLEKAFSLVDRLSKSPNIDIFGRFRNAWETIDQTKYTTSLDDPVAKAHLDPAREELIEFAMKHLELVQPRDDYRELLELSLIFLGGTPQKGIKFRYPGAFHRARWMARAIYALKIWIFRQQFDTQPRTSGRHSNASCKTSDQLLRVCLFLVTIYIKYWYSCTSAAIAPGNDLRFLKDLFSYHDQEISKLALTAFSRHLWYLSETLVGLSLFDPSVSDDDKREMVSNMRTIEGSEDPPKRIAPLQNPMEKRLPDFFTTSSKLLFEILGLDDSFLDTEPEQWRSHESFVKARNIVSTLRITNDLAERGVALTQSFNSSLVRDEEQKQFVLQMVEYHRNKFPKCRKQAND